MPRGTPLRTPERVAAAKAMRDKRASLGDIAKVFGCSPKTIHDWLNREYDSEGRAVRLRKPRHCQDCDRPISPGTRPGRCVACRAVAATVWTPVRILEAIQSWEAAYGSPPRATEWCPTLVRRYGSEAEERLAEARRRGEVPSVETVRRHFGRWSDAIVAAGFPRPRPGSGAAAWSRDEIVTAVRAWTAHTGREPVGAAWKTASKRQEAERLIGRRVPSPGVAIWHFGSWGGALLAAATTDTHHEEDTDA
ncbi:MAG: hypothetical protein JHD16_00175 [Solirubrobacteraceae bacterium]|nr:hypothetical protein [Solirubrobacteraceae bacterium]